MSSSFEESYIGQLRKLVGHKRIIVPGVRAVMRDREGRVLLIHRTDSGRWGMPAGAVEIGAEFFPMDDLPDLHEVYTETLEDLRGYNGNFILK